MNERKINDKCVHVDHDWSSTALWVMQEGRGWANTSYEVYDLPESLVDRMRYWCAWHESSEPWNGDSPGMEWDTWEAYGLAIAVDLKRELGDEYTVEYKNKEVTLKDFNLEDFLFNS